MGVEPTIPCVTGRYVTNNTSTPYCDPGQARTDDSYIKSVLLYQLSYEIIIVSRTGFEPVTFSVKGRRPKPTRPTRHFNFSIHQRTNFSFLILYRKYTILIFES